MIYDKPQDCSWFPFSDEPLKTGFSSPCIVMPQDSCDKDWHMFAKSWLGIHHFTSSCGTDWKHDSPVVFKARDPFIYKEGNTFYLLYVVRNRHSSVIEIRESDNLISWSKPSFLFEGEDLSIPQLFKVHDKYRLYFGLSEIKLADSKLCVAQSLACAEASSLFGPYDFIKTYRPLFEAKADDKWANLGCGSIRIINCTDALYAFQCGLYSDSESKEVRSAVTISKSIDGVDFIRVKDNPVLTQTESGWAGKCFTGCDVHYSEEEKCWYCFFSAGKSLGLLLGKKPTESKRRGFFRR